MSAPVLEEVAGESVFAQEILDLIIDHLYDDTPALLVCSESSRSLTPRTRVHLFRELKANLASKKRNYTALHSLLSSSPLVASVVHKLHFQFLVPIPPRKINKKAQASKFVHPSQSPLDILKIHTILSLTPNIHTLYLRDMNIQRIPSSLTPTAPQRLSLSRLILDRVGCDSNTITHTLFQLFTPFHTIETLDFGPMESIEDYEDLEENWPRPLPLPHLQVNTLRVHRQTDEPFAPYFLRLAMVVITPNAKVPLQTLHYRMEHDADMPAFEEFLNELGSSITQLTLDVSNSWRGEMHAFSHIPDFGTKTPKLESLHLIGFTERKFSQLLSSIPKTVTKFTLSCIFPTQCAISVYFTHFSAAWHWTEVDEHFAACEHVKSVSVRFLAMNYAVRDQSDEDKDLVRKYLPKLQEKVILQL